MTAGALGFAANFDCFTAADRAEALVRAGFATIRLRMFGHDAPRTNGLGIGVDSFGQWGGKGGTALMGTVYTTNWSG